MLFAEQNQSGFCQANNGQPPVTVQSPVPDSGEQEWPQPETLPLDEIPDLPIERDPDIFCVSPAPGGIEDSSWSSFGSFDSGCWNTGIDFDLSRSGSIEGLPLLAEDIDPSVIEAIREKCQACVPQVHVAEVKFQVCVAPVPKKAKAPRTPYGTGWEAIQLRKVNQESEEVRKFKTEVTRALLPMKLTIPKLKDIARRAAAQNICRKPNRLEQRGQWSLWALFLERFGTAQEFVEFVQWFGS